MATAERATAFLRAVYGWMCAALAITALVAYSIGSSPVLVEALVRNHLLFLGLFVAGLTAWDAQRLKQMALDFINLFLFLLRFLGDRRE